MIFSTVKKIGEFKTEFVTILNFALDCNEMKGRKVKSRSTLGLRGVLDLK